MRVDRFKVNFIVCLFIVSGCSVCCKIFGLSNK